MPQDSAYTLCPNCKSLNMKRATKCYSCRADLRRATKVAVDRAFDVVPVARYLTPEEIAERDAEEKARREAEAAQRTPRDPVGAMLRVVKAPFVVVRTVLRRFAIFLQSGARVAGTGVHKAARVGSSLGSSAAQSGASTGRAIARGVGAGAKAGGRAARVTSDAARAMARVGSSAVSAIARRGAGAARATTASSRRAARASAAASRRAAMASAASSRRAARASAAASRRAARASLATGRRAAAGAGAAGTALHGMTRDSRLNSRSALGVMLVVSILLILGGVSASWLALAPAGGGAGQTANMPLLIVGVIALAIGVTWAVGVVRRFRTSNPGAQ